MSRSAEQLLITDIPRVTSEVNFEEIAGLKDSLAFLLSRLHENLENNQYGVIIGDDTSGRIPAVILSRVINTLNLHRGDKAIPIFFIQGSEKSYHEQYIDLAVQRHKKRSLSAMQPNQKALLVTEHIGQGNHLRRFQTVLHSNHINFDVATVYASTSEESYRREGVIDGNTCVFEGNPNHAFHAAVLFTDFKYTGLNQQKYTQPKFIQDKNIRDGARLALQDARNIAIELVDFYKDRYW